MGNQKYLVNTRFGSNPIKKFNIGSNVGKRAYIGHKIIFTEDNIYFTGVNTTSAYRNISWDSSFNGVKTNISGSSYDNYIAYGRLVFKITSFNQYVKLTIYQNSEEDYDYAYLFRLNTDSIAASGSYLIDTGGLYLWDDSEEEFSPSNYITSFTQNVSTTSYYLKSDNTLTATKTAFGTLGTHYIDFCYKKDASGTAGEDVFKIKAELITPTISTVTKSSLARGTTGTFRVPAPSGASLYYASVSVNIGANRTNLTISDGTSIESRISSYNSSTGVCNVQLFSAQSRSAVTARINYTDTTTTETIELAQYISNETF